MFFYGAAKSYPNDPNHPVRGCDSFVFAEQQDEIRRSQQNKIAEAEAVDADEALVLVAEHRCDEARAVEDADLDICLVLTQAARREVDESEVVLAREVLHVLGDRCETAVARMLGAREVVEEPRQLLEEATPRPLRVH